MQRGIGRPCLGTMTCCSTISSGSTGVCASFVRILVTSGPLRVVTSAPVVRAFAPSGGTTRALQAPDRQRSRLSCCSVLAGGAVLPHGHSLRVSNRTPSNGKENPNSQTNTLTSEQDKTAPLQNPKPKPERRSWHPIRRRQLFQLATRKTAVRFCFSPEKFRCINSLNPKWNTRRRKKTRSRLLFTYK